MKLLQSVTFVYDMQEDRILAAINPGCPDAWSCWLTRRMVLLLLNRAAELLANTSALTQRVAPELRGEISAFEHAAAMQKTAERMSQTPSNVLSASAIAAELVKSLTIAPQGDHFRVELSGLSGGGAEGVLARIGFQRILQMLRDEVTKAGWLANEGKPQMARPTEEPDLMLKRH